MTTRDTLPKRAQTLDGIPEDWQIAYVPRLDGAGFQLSEPVALVVEEGLASMQRMRDEHAEWMARTTADINQMRADRHQRTIRLALTHYLEEAGVKPGLSKAAAAMIAEANAMVVEDDGLGEVVIANTPYGPRGAQGLVADFLASKDGEAFRPASAATISTYFGDLVRDMRREP